MFLGCSPCCGGSCPVNYYDLIDSADFVELWVQLLYLDGSGTTSPTSLFSDQTIIGPSKDYQLPSGANDLGGNVFLRASSKSKANGVLTMRAYDTTGNAGPGVLSNYFEIGATAYALTIGAHVRESSCWHDWQIREEKCVSPDVFWSSTIQDNIAAKTDMDTAFSAGDGALYKTIPAACQRLCFFNYSRYDTPPTYNASQGLTAQTIAYQPLDWSFIYPIVDSFEYNQWIGAVDMGGPNTNYPQAGTEYVGFFNVGNGRKANTPTNPEDANGYRSVGIVAVRPYEKQSFSDVYDTQQTREVVKKFYDYRDGTQRLSNPRAAESFQIQAAWAWIDGRRHSLMQTQPTFGAAELAWQTHLVSNHFIEDDSMSPSYSSPTRSRLTDRNFGSLDGFPTRAFSGSSADVCDQMGDPYGW